jgi:hypothetical protein
MANIKMIKNVCYTKELYTLGKAFTSFSIAFFLTYIIALIPLEFQGIENYHVTTAEIAYYESNLTETTSIKFEIAKAKLKAINEQRDLLRKALDLVEAVGWLALLLGSAFWILAIAFSLKTKNDENNSSSK